MKTLGEIAYIPLVWFIGRAADIELRFGMLANFVVFLPAAIIVFVKLRKYCRNEEKTAQ